MGPRGGVVCLDKEIDAMRSLLGVTSWIAVPLAMPQMKSFPSPRKMSSFPPRPTITSVSRSPLDAPGVIVANDRRGHSQAGGDPA
jgi:hypothetical protein